MKPLTLYGAPGAGSAAVEMALRTVGLDYTLVRAAEWDKASAHADLLKVNPLGQIPTLVLPDGTVLTESAAILIHLALEHPGHQLLPEAASHRAVALRGLVFIAANCYSAVSVGDYPARWTTATTKPAHARVRNAARVQLHRSWDIFFEHFSGELKRSATVPGALAFLTVVVSRWSGTRKHLGARSQSITQLLSRLDAQPRIAPVLGEHAAD